MPVAAAYASARKPWRSSASKRSYASMRTGRTPRPGRRWGRLPTRCETPSKVVDGARSGGPIVPTQGGMLNAHEEGAQHFRAHRRHELHARQKAFAEHRHTIDVAQVDSQITAVADVHFAEELKAA